MNNEITPLDQLRQLLLQEDRSLVQNMQDEMKEVQLEVSDVRMEIGKMRENVYELIDSLDNLDKLTLRVDPIVALRIVELKKNFHKTFGYEVKETVKKEIRNSKDEFVEAFYPIIGKLVRRYIKYEVEAWFEQFTNNVENVFSLEWWRSVITGKRRVAFVCQIEEVFIIAQGSGLLMGAYSKNNITDMNMIAGMLTAIRMFAGDAFKTGGDLHTIDHDSYKIFVHDNFNYYYAVVVSGLPDETFKIRLREYLDSFSENYIGTNVDPNSINDAEAEKLSAQLKTFLEDFDVVST